MLVRVSIAVIEHHHQKQLDLTACSPGSQGRNLEAETETGHGGMLPGMLLEACSMFSVIQDHLPRGGTAPSELGSPPSVINQENVHRLIWWVHFLN